MTAMCSARSAFVVASLLCLLVTALADAKQACTAQSVDGTYGYVVNGINIGQGPVAAVGIVTTDGAGGLIAADTVSVNGAMLRRTITGTYTINADCTGAAIFTDNFGQTTHLDFVLVQDRQELHFIQTDAGTVTTGAGKKQ